MINGIFNEIWRSGQKLYAFDESTASGREFYGFLEPMSFSSAAIEARDRAGIVTREEYLLIAEPSETFPYGTATLIVCRNTKFELMRVEEVYDSENISHRECVLLKAGEADSDA